MGLTGHLAWYRRFVITFRRAKPIRNCFDISPGNVVKKTRQFCMVWYIRDSREKKNTQTVPSKEWEQLIIPLAYGFWNCLINCRLCFTLVSQRLIQTGIDFTRISFCDWNVWIDSTRLNNRMRAPLAKLFPGLTLSILMHLICIIIIIYWFFNYWRFYIICLIWF